MNYTVEWEIGVKANVLKRFKYGTDNKLILSIISSSQNMIEKRRCIIVTLVPPHLLDSSPSSLWCLGPSVCVASDLIRSVNSVSAAWHDR